MMIRKDRILQSFMKHPILKSKYMIEDAQMPNNCLEALNSDVPIIRTLGLIVEELEKKDRASDNSIHQKIRTFLNNNSGI